ncbi:ATP-binding protein [Metabacillus arenae]|uniref:histidine kinase n=1 Tax=Metabacillus arenae TaxID=2771434 RepID=A0A926RX17_9BACI|nr:sensor histidine kinase [Metabacillus arenae]MBD1380521.1 sensor histidine kinase [Metabacillus arenae]
MKLQKGYTLQTKILGLVVIIVFMSVGLLTGIIAYLEVVSTKDRTKQLALQTATAVSLMPSVQKAVQSGEPSSTIQPLTEQIGYQVSATNIIVSDSDNKYIAHVDSEQIGKRGKIESNYKALVFGGYSTSESEGSFGPSIVAKAPVYWNFGEYKQVVGVVTVEYLMKEINESIINKLVKIGLFSFLALIIGISGGILLAKSIRKDTLGLEPYQISALFRERHAMLLAIREGILAIDSEGKITMMNNSARRLLNLSEGDIHRLVENVLPSTGMLRVLETGDPEMDREETLNGKSVIVNRTPIIENDQIVGVISSFRDKTELKSLIETLSEVRKHSEDLRAQTHEFTNKLYVILGLLQLDQTDEAIKFIQEEAALHKTQNKILFEQIEDPKIQAILLAKLGKASEKKINFQIDENSSLNRLPNHISLSQLITIAGNLIDNAFDAVKNQPVKKVTFFITDIGNDVVLEVSDTGAGMPDHFLGHIFDKGISSKGKDRGYGLANVKESVEQLNGLIELSRENNLTTFTIYLPKKERGRDEDESSNSGR